MARRIEVFTAGCPLCNDTLRMAREAARDCGCEIIESGCSGDVCCDEAVRYGVKAVPTVAVDGIIVFEGKPTENRQGQSCPDGENRAEALCPCISGHSVSAVIPMLKMI